MFAKKKISAQNLNKHNKYFLKKILNLKKILDSIHLPQIYC
jgi:hypothetical protein